MPVLGTIETAFKIDKQSASYLGWSLGGAIVAGTVISGIILFFVVRAFTK